MTTPDFAELMFLGWTQASWADTLGANLALAGLLSRAAHEAALIADEKAVEEAYDRWCDARWSLHV